MIYDPAMIRPLGFAAAGGILRKDGRTRRLSGLRPSWRGHRYDSLLALRPSAADIIMPLIALIFLLAGTIFVACLRNGEKALPERVGKAWSTFCRPCC
jgi:hypothetical protein